MRFLWKFKSNMPNLSTIKKWLPETYFILSVFYYWSLTSSVVNPIAISLLLILALLLWSKNRILGTAIGIVLLVINLFLLLALASELREFPAAGKDFYTMLIFGLSYLGLNILVAVLLLMKWYNYSESKIIEAPAN